MSQNVPNGYQRPTSRWFQFDALTIIGLVIALAGLTTALLLALSLPTLSTNTRGQVVTALAVQAQYSTQVLLAKVAGFGGVLVGGLLVLVAPTARQANR